MEHIDYHLKYEIPSERKSIKLVENILSDLKCKLSLTKDFYYNLLIAVTEAVNNAIIHGNCCDIAKITEIEIDAVFPNLKITVNDNGNGFDFLNLDDPRIPENIYKENGRGVFLIKELAEKVEFVRTPKGMSVIMFFKLS